MRAVLGAIVAIALGVGVGTANASVTVYECQLRTVGNHGWVADQMVIARDAATDRTIVNDPLIFMANEQQPVDAEIIVDTDSRFTARWVLRGMRSRSGQSTPRFVYRATVFKKDGRISVYATPAGYSNNFLARGTCRVGTS